MNHARTIGQLSTVAVGLGIWAALSSGTAAADPTEVDASAFDPSALISDVAAPISSLNFAISVDGHTFEMGSATASSGTGDIAIAYGADSNAAAGSATNPGEADYAFADGAGSQAYAGIGNDDLATAYGTDSVASAGSGTGDIAYADGTDTDAYSGGLYNSVNGVGVLYTAGNSDIASAIGAGDNAQSGAGVLDPFSTVVSNGDIATILGNGSDAYSGEGNLDLAAVFGDTLTATAAPGSDLFEVVPSSATALFDSLLGI